MRQRLKQTTIEWAFMAALLVLFAVLTALQFRWTAERAQAVKDRALANFGDQVRALCQAFDTELRDDCRLLVPPFGEINQSDRETVHVQRFRQWLASKHRPIFKRLAVVVAGDRGLTLYFLDQKSAGLIAADWPAEWETLREHFLERMNSAHPPPFRDSRGLLWESPVFGNTRPPPGDRPPNGEQSPFRARPPTSEMPADGKRPPGQGEPPPGRPTESEWMLFELDLNYIQQTWLPELTRAYLNSAGGALSDVLVKTTLPPQEVIYSSGQPPSGGDTRMVTARLDSPMRVPFDGGLGGTAFWTMDAWLHPGALEAAVAIGRWRNLALVCLLNGLFVVAGLALLRYTRRSRQVAEAQLRFVSTVSHELRTPLTVIRGAGQNLLRGIVTEPAHVEQYGRFIMQHADQLTEMIEQMLAAGQIRRNIPTVDAEPVDLGDVLEKAIAATLPETKAANCKVEATILSHLPRIAGNAGALQRVFQNLLTNAAKYGGSGHWIGVRTDYRQGDSPPAVEIQIADRGDGIPANERATIFEAFVRGAAAEAQQIRGTGLGLSLVREIVEAHHGTITVQSTVGAGTTFTVRLPVSILPQRKQAAVRVDPVEAS